MYFMDAPSFPAPTLPADAAPALAIAARLAAHGHVAYLAGGCVRDLLLGAAPHDFDIATDAVPARVQALFRPTREVGAQFGVVLVRSGGRWVEVATFRSDGTYSDGRRPDSVRFGDARQDALRRDFTINGMFLDPGAGRVIDFVGGADDLRRRILRAIGDPRQRFEEDHLRLLRAVRFAARLGFELEPETRYAMRASAHTLPRVAPERVLDELERILTHASRAHAVSLLAESGLLAHLWPGAPRLAADAVPAARRLGSLPADAGFEAALAALLESWAADAIDAVCRQLTCSNEQRENTVWLVQHAGDLDDPARPTLAELKRLMAHPAFPELLQLASARHAALPDAAERQAALRTRLDAIPPDSVRPPPLVTGDDLIAAGATPGPLFRRVLETLYTRQLDEELTSRPQALEAMRRLLERG